MNEITCEDMLNIVLRAGTIVLENGGETYRTEETMSRIATSLGAKTASAFVTPTVIQFSYTDERKHYHSALRRITRRAVNLKKVSIVNDLSRRLVKRGRTSNPRQIDTILDRIEHTPEYHSGIIVLTAALSSMSFAFMFGGNVNEGAAALFTGFILRTCLIFLQRVQLISSFITSVISGALISVMTELFFIIKFIPSTNIALTAALMQVVPGLAIVNGIRDIIAGDLVSGNARIVDAFMTAAGLSVGSVFGMLIFSRIM